MFGLGVLQSRIWCLGLEVQDCIADELVSTQSTFIWAVSLNSLKGVIYRSIMRDYERGYLEFRLLLI